MFFQSAVCFCRQEMSEKEKECLRLGAISRRQGGRNCTAPRPTLAMEESAGARLLASADMKPALKLNATWWVGKWERLREGRGSQSEVRKARRREEIESQQRDFTSSTFLVQLDSPVPVAMRSHITLSLVHLRFLPQSVALL
jgi:hypothetical protein